jgi:hypothetical protein
MIDLAFRKIGAKRDDTLNHPGWSMQAGNGGSGPIYP